MSVSILSILVWLTTAWVLMLVVDGFYGITTPKVDHPYKNFGAGLITFSVVGWVFFAIAHLLLYLGVTLTWV